MPLSRPRSWLNRNAAAKAQEVRPAARSRTSVRRAVNAQERLRREIRVQRLHEDAVVRTDKAEQRVQRLNVVLIASLRRTVEPIDFERQKRDVPDLDLGPDAEPVRLPTWEEYAPRSGRLRRLLTSQSRRETAQARAEVSYARALDQYREQEAARVARVEELLRAHNDASAPERQRILAHNAAIDAFRDRVMSGDREAVSEYFTQAFESVTDSGGFPRDHRFAYVPESKLLLVEWRVPGVDVVPREREFRYNKSTDSVGVHRWRPIAEVRRIHARLLAQLALRATNVAFSADPGELVQTVVFDGVTSGRVPKDEDAPTGRRRGRTGPAADDQAEVGSTVCLISMSASRRHFAKLRLDDIDDPLEQVRKHFGALVSAYPDELSGITPILTYDLADPHLSVPASTKVPNLIDAPAEEFGRLMERLLERMGYAVAAVPGVDGNYLASRGTDDGVENAVVHVRRHTGLLETAEVRALQSAVRREHAQVGILLTSGGLDPQAYEYAHGRPLRLYDGHNLVALCRQYDLPARLEPAKPGESRTSTDRARDAEAPRTKAPSTR
ncbi:restriction endonuclease [Actinopolymorpha pittospori]|uniref:Restriction system protein n=1 Tax=Actinopolymorpha pittospori TaxID=648752 RepID=A0A927RAT3_9ACTN|nr:restriction system protein [Actinopolymorpha pittospori]